jgi:uncharacterized protein (UPF0261 family)
MLSQKRAWVAATLDTKIDETLYVCHLLEAAGLAVHLADLSRQRTCFHFHRKSTVIVDFASDIGL